MDVREAMTRRHAVRRYTDEPLGRDVRTRLEQEVAAGNAEGGLAMRLVCDEPKAFDSAMAHYGKFGGVRNYLVLAGAAAPDLNERCGYYGERVVLLAQQLGIDSCWVALTFKKRLVRKTVAPGTKLALVVALGHGAEAGSERRSKSVADVCTVPDGASMPDWFARGAEAALLAPTAMNQQKFRLELTGQTAAGGVPTVRLTSLGGMYADVDLGIVRLHFELGAGRERFAWA